MRRFVSLSLLGAMVFPAVASAADPFSDISKSPYKSDIAMLQNLGILDGYKDGTFRPKQKVNRAELMKVAIGDTGISVTPKRRCFPDVPTNVWYARYVCEGKQRRIAKGHPNGNFKPEETVNFAEALAILLRANKVAVAQGSDVWYQPYVEYADDYGILSDNSYTPNDPLTRERLAQMVAGIRRAKNGKSSASSKPTLVATTDTAVDVPPLRPSAPLHAFKSTGCGKATPDSIATSVEVNGVLRSFILRVPTAYSSDKPSKIIFAYHGRTNSNAQVQSYMGLDKAGSEYLVVYPAALKNGSSYKWDASDEGDYAFFDRMLQALGEQYCIDEDQVYVVGYSLGAWFANSLACARGDLIRGVATLGGSATGADCSGPVAAMVLHNPNDQSAVFSGGVAARDKYLEQNSCLGTETVPIQPEMFKCVKYTGCGSEDPVVWCPHEINNAYWDNSYYPHVWPKETGKYIIDFFRGLEHVERTLIR